MVKGLTAGMWVKSSDVVPLMTLFVVGRRYTCIVNFVATVRTKLLGRVRDTLRSSLTSSCELRKAWSA